MTVESENFIHDKYGYCGYSIEPDKRPVIFNLYTEPEYRRKGHARKHIQYVINEIKETGYKGEIEIELIPREGSIDTVSLLSFYKSMGLSCLATIAAQEKPL